MLFELLLEILRHLTAAGLLVVVDLPLIHYSVNWWRTLHQDATISTTDVKIDGLMLFTLFLAMVVAGLVMTWLLIHRFRLAWLEAEVEEGGLDGALAERRAEAEVSRQGLSDREIKRGPGGIRDIEFAVQTLVLAHARRYPELTQNLGNIALLKMCADLGLIDAGIAEGCRSAYRKFRRLQHALRLNGAQYARVPPEQVAAKSAAVRALWAAVFAT